MTKCRKLSMSECEYFVAGGCVSPFNCSYKAENESITTAISASCNLYPLEADKDKGISRLQAENAELRATLSKMETVEKELTDRLKNAVELPYMYEAELVDSAGHFLKTIYVVVHNNDGTIQAIQYSYKKVAEAKLKALQGRRSE